MPSSAEFDHGYAAEQVRRRNHPLRRWIKGFYLRRLLAEVRGATLDIGCGAGQLLERLPPGSAGLEINPHLAGFLQRLGLQVVHVDAGPAVFDLEGFPPGAFRSVVVAHVLEHLEDPASALQRLFAACRRIGVERVVVVVPGARGFASDRTHRTFIDRSFVERLPEERHAGFVRRSLGYFPGPWAWIGRWFVFHEMIVVFERRATASF